MFYFSEGNFPKVSLFFVCHLVPLDPLQLLPGHSVMKPPFDLKRLFAFFYYLNQEPPPPWLWAPSHLLAAEILMSSIYYPPSLDLRFFPLPLE